MRTGTFSDRQIAVVATELSAVVNLVLMRANPKAQMAPPASWEAMAIPERDKTMAFVRRLLQSEGHEWQPGPDEMPITDPLSSSTTPEGVHNYLWSEHKKLGWTRGKTVDVDTKKAPFIAPWDETSTEHKLQVTMLVAMVRVLGSMPKEFGS